MTVAEARPVRRQARGERQDWLVAACRVVGRATARTLFSLEVVGLENVPRHGAVLLAGNHTGFVDGPLVFLFSPRPTSLLAKSEIFAGAGARVFAWLGCVPVHRGTADRAALQQALALLDGERAVGVFPEGRRSSGTLEEITDGLAYLALRSGAAVVPIAVTGTAQAWPKGSPLPRFRSPVRIAFGTPVQVDVVGGPRARSTVRAAAEQLREALLAHLTTPTPLQHHNEEGTA
ncbi:MAG: putative transferase match [Frankiales bacterium]|nr:putative transferase match [Frankiales bacterium]